MEKKSTKIAYFVALGVFIVLLVILGVMFKDAPLPTLEVDGEMIEATTPFAGTFWSLLPPIVAIVLALISKEVYSSLFLGCLVGALLVSNFHPWETVVQLVEGDNGIVTTVSDAGNIAIIVFLVVLGIMVDLMNKTGGSEAFGRWATKTVKTRAGAQLIDNRAIDEAIDRVQAGPKRRSKGMALDELRNTAYHEGGHALVAAAMNDTDPVTKVTILPRGRALGYTAVMPTEDRYSMSRNQLLDQMAYAMGGRTAEEVVFHDPTTGASNDIEKATNIARQMVLDYGFSDKLGAIKWSDDEQSDLGSLNHKYSARTAEIIDEEVLKLVETAHTEAWNVINENREILDELVRQLLVKETLNEKELAEYRDRLKN